MYRRAHIIVFNGWWFRKIYFDIITAKLKRGIFMELKDKLQLLRKQNGYSQEQLADKLGIARQTLSKWENGQAVPELGNLISLSNLYGITIDRIVKDDDECNISLCKNASMDINKIIEFFLVAKKNTYAAANNKVDSCRMNSHDYRYQNKNGFTYLDSYLGGECFVGEEVVWLHDIPVWSMNYVGRVIGENFSGDFLKEVLMQVPAELPFRGSEIYTKGNYHYHCKVDGEFVWFQGYEVIFYMDEKIYECYFHGGTIR